MKITYNKHTTLAILGAGLLAMAMPMASHADVMASAMVKVTNFRILGSDNQILDATGANTANPTGDFATLAFTNNADQTVALSGFAPVVNSSNATNADFAPICVGAGCSPITPNNTFPKLTNASLSQPNGNYSAADQLQNGAPITGIPGLSDPATVATGSYVNIDTGSSIGSATSNDGLQSSFVFRLNQDQGITFDFDVDAWLQVFVSGSETFPSRAAASIESDLSIVEINADGSTGATVFSASPDLFATGPNELALGSFLNTDLEITRNTGGPVHFAITTGVLSANKSYQLTANVQAKADATRDVPEPGMLALMGMGLLGMGMARRHGKA